MSTNMYLEEKSYAYTHHCILLVLFLFSCDLGDILFTPLNYMLVRYATTIQAHEA